MNDMILLVALFGFGVGLLLPALHRGSYRKTLLLKSGQFPTPEKLPDGNFYYIVPEHEYVQLQLRKNAAAEKPDLNLMADRFCGWPMPSNFSPDCYVRFDKDAAIKNKSWPTGTNLLTHEQAKEMLRYVLSR